MNSISLCATCSIPGQKHFALRTICWAWGDANYGQLTQDWASFCGWLTSTCQVWIWSGSLAVFDYYATAAAASVMEMLPLISCRTSVVSTGTGCGSFVIEYKLCTTPKMFCKANRDLHVNLKCKRRILALPVKPSLWRTADSRREAVLLMDDNQSQVSGKYQFCCHCSVAWNVQRGGCHMQLGSEWVTTVAMAEWLNAWLTVESIDNEG